MEIDEQIGKEHPSIGVTRKIPNRAKPGRRLLSIRRDNTNNKQEGLIQSRSEECENVVQ
jgi:hypothetical protein